MKRTRTFQSVRCMLAVGVALGVLVAVQCINHPPKVAAAGSPSSSTPCVGNPAPAKWNHVVVLIFENQDYTSVIGNSSAPYATGLANKCGTAGNVWHDADYSVTGSRVGSYFSKPNYATYTSGVSPSVHGLGDDSYGTTSGVDNIYNELNKLGKSGVDYYDGSASSDPCGGGSNFSGAYHDAVRYYTDIGGTSSTTSTYCNTHDKSLSQFMTDVNAGNLPAFSVILPTNSENDHDNSVSSGDTWAQNFLNPLLDSNQYKSGDTAVFYVWDEGGSEGSFIPNVLIAPSITPGSKVPAPTGNPISHFAALRTWEDMLGLPYIGDTAQAPSMLSFFGGTGSGTTDNPPAVSITSPANNATLTANSTTVTANATDDVGVSKVEFYVNGTLTGTDTSPSSGTTTNGNYNFTWNTSSLSGAQTLTTKAYDTGGHVTTSSTVTVTVTPQSCSPTTPYGTATQVISIPANGTYNIWSRIMAPDTTNNSYYIQIDAGCPTVVGDSSTMSANSWTWVNYQNGNTASGISATLTAGNHTITMIGREPGVKLDRVLFLSASCTPTGTGANCLDTTPPTVSLTAPSSGQTVSGSITVSANAADEAGGSGLSKVDFLVDGNSVGTSTTSPYQITWDTSGIANGSHTITARATDGAGNVGTSAAISVTVSNSCTSPSGQCMPTGDISGWHQVFSDDFTTNVPVGGFSGCNYTGNYLTSTCSGLPSGVSSKWFAYPDGWQDTTKNGTYEPSQVMSIANGVMNLNMHTSGGVHMVSAPVPKIPGATGKEGGMLYGRYAVRFKADSAAGFKTAFLLWPDSETWPADGEIDFPEGNLNGTISAFLHHMNGTSGSDQDAYSSSSAYTSWHTAVTEWTANQVKFILDGTVIGTSTTRIPSTPMHWVLQSETSTDGTVPSATATSNIQIDWVSVYTPSATATVQGDFTGDGHVNGADLAIFLGHWMQSGAGQPEDLNNDGVVNGADMAMFLGDWGQ